MDNLPVQLVLLALWLGTAIYGATLLLQKGYKVNFLRVLGYYITPAVVVAYFLFNIVQPASTTWPTNIPVCLANVLLVLIMIVLSPALLLAGYILPTVKGLDAPTLAQQRDKFVRTRGWLVFAGSVFIVVILPILAQSLFRAAPAYERVVSVFIDGLISGSVFSLIALGYTLVYGIVELINFAHGDVFMIGSLVGFTVLSLMLGAVSSQPIKDGTPFILVIGVILLAMLIAMTVCALLNYSINRFAYKPLRNAPRLAPLISAIGVSFILQNAGLYLNGSTPKGYPLLFPTAAKFSNVDLFRDILGVQDSKIPFQSTALLVVGGAAALLLGMRFLINSTKIGKAMRAVAQSPEAAALMGISIERTIGFAFIVGGALAGAAGVLYGVYQVQGTVRYDLGFVNGLFAFTAAVLGGIGNVNGAVLGGLFIGIVYSLSQSSFFGLTSGYLVLSGWAPVAVFGVLVLVMVFRPTGILGDNVQEKV